MTIVENYLGNVKKAIKAGKITDKNTYKYMDQLTTDLYDYVPDDIDKATDKANLIFVDDVDDDPEDYEKDGFSKNDIDKINTAKGDYVNADTLKDVTVSDLQTVISYLDDLD